MKYCQTIQSFNDESERGSYISTLNMKYVGALCPIRHPEFSFASQYSFLPG